MTQEFDLRQDNGHIEDNKPTDYEKKVQILTEEVMKHTPDSPTFQAFADFADSVSAQDNYLTTKEQKLDNADVNTAAMELALVNETIRQRKNEPTGFRGYRNAYMNFQLNGEELLRIAPRDLDEISRRKTITRSLQGIKNNVIDEKNYRKSNKSTETY